jgi:hypothetical protein
MHKFRTILSVVATAAMVLGTMGAATASAASVNETRADFIAQLDQSLGIQPVNPSTPDFSDVPASNADYGYIEAAYQKGFVNGIAKGFFGPTLPITRAEAAKILVEAYEGGNYTPTQTSTTFTDNASIPTALVGYVAEAASLKLMLGFTSGGFGPEAYLTTAQETHLIAQLKALEATGGPYNWRWIVAANSGLAEQASANAMNFLADAVAGRPFSAVTSYIDPADAATLETEYGEIAKNAAANFNGGLDAGTANAVIKIVGGGFVAGLPASGGGWRGSANVIVEAISNTTGNPSAVNSNSPYFALTVALNTNSNGLVAQTDTNVNSLADSTVSPAESVAGIVMHHLGGPVDIYPNSEDAGAVVGGLGLAQTAGQ